MTQDFLHEWYKKQPTNRDIVEIAKKLNLTSKEVIEVASSLNISVKSHLSGVDEEEAKKIEAKLLSKKTSTTKVKEEKKKNI